MRLIALVATTALILALTRNSSAGGEAPKWVGGPHYFSSLSAKSLPETPKNLISETEAKRPDREGAYYVAHFDQQGRLLSLEKVYKGKNIGRSTYRYDGRGKLLSGEVTEPDGPTLSYRADPSGKLIRAN